MARRSDPRPPVEIVGEDSTEEPPSRVRVGSGRPGRRGAALVLAVALAALAIGVLTSGDGDGDDRASAPDDAPSTTTETDSERSAATATSVVGGESGSVFGQPAGASLLIGSDDGGWRVLDLDSGALREVPSLAGVPSWGMVPVDGGVVIADPIRGGPPNVVELPSGERRPLAIRFQTPPARIGMVTGVLASGRPDQVWVALTPTGGPPHPDATPHAVLVGLDGEAAVQLELRRRPTLGTAAGLVFTVGGRTYLQDAGGTRPLGDGTAHAASATEVALLTCDDQALCRADVVDVTTGDRREALALPDVDETAVWLGLDADGAVAMLPASPSDLRSGGLTAGPGALRLVLGEPGHEVRSVEVPSIRSAPVWLPGDLGLAMLTGYGLVRYVDEGNGLVGHRVEGLRTVDDDTLLVIPDG